MRRPNSITVPFPYQKHKCKFVYNGGFIGANPELNYYTYKCCNCEEIYSIIYNCNYYDMSGNAILEIAIGENKTVVFTTTYWSNRKRKVILEVEL